MKIIPNKLITILLSIIVLLLSVAILNSCASTKGYYGRARVQRSMRPERNQTELFLGRGFTGHEHLTWFGLINMNARLYDPLLGRFLSPDPYVQAPDFTQNFNRYSYALNNPLKFTDDTGEFALTTMLTVAAITAAVFGVGNVGAHMIRDDISFYDGVKYFFSGAIVGAAVGTLGYYAFAGATAMANASSTLLGRCFWRMTAFNVKWMYPMLTGVNFVASAANGVANDNGQWFNNFAKTLIGNFYLDERKTFMGQVWEGFSRHTWESVQQVLGYAAASIKNGWNDRVDYWGGATFGTNFNGKPGPGFTIGSYININSNEKNLFYKYSNFDDYLMSSEYMAEHFYVHEYGHTIQSKIWGPLYSLVPTACSLYSAITNSASDHHQFWTEVWANTYSENYFKKHYSTYSFPSCLIVR